MKGQIAIFGSARVNERDPLYKRTEIAASKLVSAGYRIATGGGPGLMEAANKGALSVCADTCCSLGYSIYLPFESSTNDYVQHDCPHETFHSRLEQFCQENDGFIALPGGYGTLLEIMMVVQLIQVKHIDKPLILVGPMWKGLMSTISSVLYRCKYIDEKDLACYWEYTETPEGAADKMIELLS